MDLFLRGVVAGYGIAIPVGPVAVLIMRTATQRGFAPAAAAGLGTATADLVYALVAVLFGAAAAEALAPATDALQIVAAVALFAIAIWGLVGARKPAPAAEAHRRPSGLVGTWAAFLGITILNPATITYFVALVLGLQLGDVSAGSKALFVVGAFLASASWQLGVAAAGAALHRALGDRARLVTSVAGSLIIAGLAVYTLAR